MSPSIQVLALILASLQVSTSLYASQATNQGPDPQQLAVAYETACVSSLRVLNTAEVTHRGADWKKGFAKTLAELGPKGEGMIESVLASGEKAGYRFILTPGTPSDDGGITHYTISARPIRLLVKGQSSFFTDETGIIRFTKEDRPATVSDPPVK